MDKHTQNISRNVIRQCCDQAISHLIHLHAELIFIGNKDADEWISHMISALNTISEYYKQDTWE